MAQIAVIGLGRFGFHVAQVLAAAGHEVLAIDQSQEPVQRAKDLVTRAVAMDARDKERLEALGIAGFDVVVVSLGERIDTSTLVALHLKELGVPKIVTKAGSEDHAKLLSLIGVHEIVFPEREAAERLAHRLDSTNLLDYIPLGESHSIEEIAPTDAMLGCTLAQLKLRNRFDVQVLGVRDALSGRVTLGPGADFRVKESDALVILGRNDDLQALKRDS